MQQQQSTPLSFFQKAEIVRNLLVFPALTLLVFFRRNLGYRLVRPGWVLGMAFLVWMIAMLFQDPVRGRLNLFMMVYAYAIAGLGLFHRLKAWWFLRKGRAWHTYDPGTSGFESMLPRFARRNRIVARVFDPIVSAFFGLFVMIFVSPAFGYWLIFSAFCLFWFEMFVHHNAVDRDLDLSDGLISANVQSESAKHFTQPVDSGKKSEGAAIPTGVAEDIRKRGVR